MTSIRPVVDQRIPTHGEIRAAWLTDVLRSSGALHSGAVATIATHSETSTHAQIERLAVNYTEDAVGELPARLLVKRCAGPNFGPSEMTFYTYDYRGVADAPLPRCYAAQYQAMPQQYAIILEDLEETHCNGWQRTPTLRYAQALGAAFAALHGVWWGRERLQAGAQPEPSAAAIARYVAHIRPGLAPLLEAVPDLAPNEVALLHDIFAHHPRLMQERLAQPTGWTLIHGDPNPGNILQPKTGDGPVVFIDRQPFDWSLQTWLGVSDLTYASVHWWEPEQRRALEQPLLHSYLAALHARGITAYSGEQLWQDYRLCAVQSMYVAVEWCVLPEDRTRMRWVWVPQLRRALAALHDLDCAALWR